jgi:hypothetical protein
MVGGWPGESKVETWSLRFKVFLIAGGVNLEKTEKRLSHYLHDQLQTENAGDGQQYVALQSASLW